MTGSTMEEAFAHHLWATDRLFEACADLTPEQLAATAPGTYGSIHQTLHHLVESDRWYIHFYPPADALPPMEEEPLLSLAELRDEMDRDAQGWPQVLVNETDGARDIASRGQEAVFHSPLAIRLAQVLHHGTDHRSQVCTILSTLGVEPPDIDVWAYGEATGQTRDEALPTG